MMGLVEYESPWWWYFAEINYSRDGFTREHGTRGLQAELVQVSELWERVAKIKSMCQI